ncbi:MAG: hypothetical protein EXR73_02535 [Myxococcales bacterium]|nr:hypothetical protein [Myxococcales bacterium]
MSLVELMVVVSIMSVLVALAVNGPKGHPVPEAARSAQGMLSEARRHAVEAGPVRAPVAAALGTTARVRVEFSSVSGRNVLRIFDLVEEPAPSTSATWRPAGELFFSGTVELVAVSAAAQSEPGGVAAPLLGGGTVNKYFFPNGRADAMTLYFRKRVGPADEYRVFVLPVSGIATMFKGW